jgi:hypothetical protein
MSFSFCHPLFLSLFILVLVLGAVETQSCRAQGSSMEIIGEFARWSVNGTVMHQFQSDLDRGGNFSVNRFSINGRWSHVVNAKLSLGIGLRYGYEDYSFSDTVDFSGKAPWGDIHLPDLSLGAFYRIDSGWQFLTAVTGGLAGESGADTGDSLIYGGILAATKKIGSDLTLGLGAGVYRRFEETSFFPLLFVRWKISEEWSLGNALQAGPTGPAGLELVYRPGGGWAFGLGWAYRSVRFRLDKDGTAPGGIGQEKGFPVWLRASRQLGKGFSVDFSGGLMTGGELLIEDRSGRELTSDHYQTTPFMALSFSWRI